MPPGRPGKAGRHLPWPPGTLDGTGESWREAIPWAGGGHLLCVIPVHSDPGAFKAQATTWP